MSEKINIAIAGLGVVGKGVYEILKNNRDILQKRSSNYQVVAVSARNKKDFIDGVDFYQNALDLADIGDVDMIVELIGGDSGIAYELCKKALTNGKHFVTANKAMIAKHGAELANLAQQNHCALLFEAAVAGAIPVVKSIKEQFIGNKISKIAAILNGTCNYILTKMEKTGGDFSDILKQAQELGYAEADPTFDIEGIDTAHKLAILASLAKNSRVDFDALSVEGITKITIDDIRFACELGFKIKLLGIYEDFGDKISQAVYPALVEKNSLIAQVDDSFNAVLSFGDGFDESLLVGRGAGSKPTASAVVGDIFDIVDNRYSRAFVSAPDDLMTIETKNIDDFVGDFYIRFKINQEFAKHGKIAEIFDKNLDEIVTKSIEGDDENLLTAVIVKNFKGDKFRQDILQKLDQIDQISDVYFIRCF